MLKYILKRLLMFIPVVLGVLFVTFTINYFARRRSHRHIRL